MSDDRPLRLKVEGPCTFEVLVTSDTLREDMGTRDTLDLEPGDTWKASVANDLHFVDGGFDVHRASTVKVTVTTKPLPPPRPSPLRRLRAWLMKPAPY